MNREARAGAWIARRPGRRDRRRDARSASCYRLDWHGIRRLDGLLRGDYRTLRFTATASTWPTCASTSPATTSATSTGT